MVTYRKELAREHWHRPWPIRVLLVLLGVVLIMAGGVAWSLEDVYGGDSDRQEYVVGHDALTGTATATGEDGTVYETDSIADAEAYVESQRGSHSYAVPILLLIGGGMAIVVGIAPVPSKREQRHSVPTLGANT